MPRVMIIVGSVRPVRKGIVVAEWVRERLARTEGVEVDFADLRAIALPFYDETIPAARGEYEHEHTKAWAARVGAADAFILVNPEFNGSFVAPVKNAFDYLYAEWGRKPIGFVNYGNYGGGGRSAAALQPVIAALGLVPTRASVSFRMIAELVADGRLEANEVQEQTLDRMIGELVTLSEALRSLR